MSTKGEKIGKVLRIFVVFFIVVLGFFANSSWAQVPTIVNSTPGDKSWNIPINTTVTMQFSTSMNPNSSWVGLLDEYGNDIDGTWRWNKTVYDNDTITFIPNRALRHATHYRVHGGAWSVGGVGINGYNKNFDFYFMTKPSTADATPPTIQMVYPYNGMTGVSTASMIFCKFSEAMHPPSINSTNITLAGPGISGPSDYSVNYAFETGGVGIKKNTPFTASSTYTVTITTNVKDLRGNWLKEQYQWSFTTGSSDTTAPTVTLTIPTNGATKVSTYPYIYAVFSENMDEGTLNTSNITLYDNTAGSGVSIFILDEEEDWVTFVPVYGTQLQNGHLYIVTIGTGVKDQAGNGLSTPYSWSFTVAGAGVDSDPVLMNGISIYSHVGKRWSSGSTGLELEIGAWDDHTSPLTVTATHDSYSWPLTSKDDKYSYESTGDEKLSSGTHTLTFTIKDGATPQNQVTFQRDIYIFDSWPVLNSPTNGSSGVSTTPTFQWSYSGSSRPLVVYRVAVFDGPNPDTARQVWSDLASDKVPGTYSLSIPADKHLAPNTTYYWGVICYLEIMFPNIAGKGEAFSDIFWSFTTGGTPPPAPHFEWVLVRSDDRTTGLGWNVGAKVLGPSPADIVELKVTGPGGFKYIFTEDDIQQGEQNGLYFWRQLTQNLSDGDYTFTVTDSLGRTATINYSFSNATIPRVNSSTMVPADSSYVNTTTPTFSWSSVGTGYYYRIQIFDWNFRVDSVYISGYTQDTQITVPSGYLLPNTPYKWRVEVFDEPKNNRSVSDTFRFSTGNYPYTLDLNWGIVWSDNNYYSGDRKSLQANVIGPLPNHVAQLNVTGPESFSYNFKESDIQFMLYVLNIPGSLYAYGAAEFPVDGTYNFNLQDIYGSTDSYNKGQTSMEIPIVDQGSLYPANNTYIYTLTPTFTWTAVVGSNRYYRVTINDWKTNYTIYQSSRSTDLYAQIPIGILKPNRSYKWRVEVFDNSSGLLADNRSSSGWNCFTTEVPTITVTSPNGGENWLAGTTHTISWTYTGNPGSSVRIELLKGVSVDRTIVNSTPIGSGGNGSYPWTIDPNQTPGNDYKIRVTSTTNSAYTDTSDNYFTIDWQSESVNWQVDYGNNWNRSGTVTKQGATRIRLRFSTIDVEKNYGHLRTDAGNDWSGSYSNVYSNEKAGDSIGLTLTSDYSVTGYFIIDRVEWQGSATGPATKSGNLFGNPPSPPMNVSASDGTYIDRVRVTWTASSGAIGYKLFRHTSNDSSSALQIGTTTTSSYDDKTAVTGTTYWYWARAYNIGGDSGFNNGDSGYVDTSWQSESVNWSVAYGNNWNRSGTVTKPGSTRIRLHFKTISMEAPYDHLKTEVGDDWSGDFGDVTSHEKAGNSIGLTLTSDYSKTGYFIIDRVEWRGTSTGPAKKSGTLFQ
jgi:methionine-rich copper-binding protein CopC